MLFEITKLLTRRMAIVYTLDISWNWWIIHNKEHTKLDLILRFRRCRFSKNTSLFCHNCHISSTFSWSDTTSFVVFRFMRIFIFFFSCGRNGGCDLYVDRDSFSLTCYTVKSNDKTTMEQTNYVYCILAVLWLINEQQTSLNKRVREFLNLQRKRRFRTEYHEFRDSFLRRAFYNSK